VPNGQFCAEAKSKHGLLVQQMLVP